MTRYSLLNTGTCDSQVVSSQVQPCTSTIVLAPLPVVAECSWMPSTDAAEREVATRRVRKNPMRGLYIIGGGGCLRGRPPCRARGTSQDTALELLKGFLQSVRIEGFSGFFD